MAELDMTETEVLFPDLCVILPQVAGQFQGEKWKYKHRSSNSGTEGCLRASVYDALNDFISKGVIGEIVSDRQGRIWIEISPGATQNAPTVLTTDTQIIKADWMGEPAIEERITKSVSALELGGVIFDGASASIALLSIAPGYAPSTRGKINRIEGYIGVSQQQMNEVCGDYYAYLTARYALGLKMSGNYNNIDIAPIRQYLVNLLPADNVRGLNWVNRTFHPVQMDWSYDSEHGSMYPIVKFAQVTNGLAGGTEAVASTPTGTWSGMPTGSWGTDIVIPEIPPYDFPEIPVFTIPALPPFTIPPFPGFNLGSPTYTWVISNPAAGFIPGPWISIPKVIKSIRAYTVGGTSVTFNVEVRTDPSSAGTNTMNPDLTSTPAAVVSAVLGLVYTALMPGNWLWLHMSAVVGAVTDFVVTVEAA